MKVVDRNLDGGAPVESGRAQEAQRGGPTGGVGAVRAGGRTGGGDQVEFSNTLGSLARAMGNAR